MANQFPSNMDLNYDILKTTIQDHMQRGHCGSDRLKY